MKRAGIIINPNAKKIRTGRTSLDKYRNIKSECFDLRISESLEQIKYIAMDFKRENIDYIAIAGGDGTIHLTLTEIIRIYGESAIPAILILKEGTMDNIARSINLKGNGLSLIKKLKESLESGQEIETHSRRTLKINGRYCFIFGTGFIANFLNEVYSGKEKGFIRNIQVGFDSIKEAIVNKKDGRIFNLINEKIKIDDNDIEFNEINGILAGTVEHVGMSFSPLRNAAQNESEFQVIITGMNPRKMLLNINKLRVGKKINSEGYCNIMAKKLNIVAESEFDYTMDGDMYVADRELEVSLGPVVRLVKL